MGQYKTWTADCGLRTTDCGLGIKYGLGIKCGLRTEYKTRTRYKTRTTDYIKTTLEGKTERNRKRTSKSSSPSFNAVHVVYSVPTEKEGYAGTQGN